MTVSIYSPSCRLLIPPFIPWSRFASQISSVQLGAHCTDFVWLGSSWLWWLVDVCLFTLINVFRRQNAAVHERRAGLWNRKRTGWVFSFVFLQGAVVPKRVKSFTYNVLLCLSSIPVWNLKQSDLVTIHSLSFTIAQANPLPLSGIWMCTWPYTNTAADLTGLNHVGKVDEVSCSFLSMIRFYCSFTDLVQIVVNSIYVSVFSFSFVRFVIFALNLG